ncbi:restriction endonuclease subunit S [Pseudanabaena minima]|uniref:restriction endonuclease subunit S n=1 Tax=Pseudanabaena minima TaxID=890415 RepID=UPI003DA999C6
MAFPKYESYKDSGVEWLGEIPSHWESKRNLGLFDERKETNRPDMELLSVTIDQGVIRQSEISIKKDSSNEDKSKYKVVYRGDLAYNKMRMWQGAIGMSDYTGIVSPAYIILNTRNKNYAKFFHYLYRTELFIREANRHSYGLCSDMNSLRYEDFKTLYSPVPPHDEVNRIVDFLDRITNDIDQAIAKKQRLIELLNEQKAILINRAVTKGLNPNIPMRDSGIEWIGEIPEHWKSQRLKFSVKNIYDCKNRTPEYFENGEYFVIRTSNVRNGKLSLEDGFYTDRNNFIKWTQKGQPLPNELVFTREAPAGEVAMIPDNNIEMCLGQRMMGIKTNENEVLSNYLLYFLQSQALKEYVAIKSAGSTVSHLRVGQVFDIPIIYPSSISEQKEIADLCSRYTEEIDYGCKFIQNDIEKIREFHKTLIAEAVTGKIKV